MKRIVEDLTNWNMQKMFLVFYYTKYGIKNLPFNSVEAFMKFLGMKETGLRMWEHNFRFLLGKKKRTLAHFSKEQAFIVCAYNVLDKHEMEEKACYYIEKNS